MGRFVNSVLEKYSDESYEKKGKIRTLLYFMMGILPLVTTHFLVMILILGNSISSRFSLIMMGLILVILLCVFLTAKGYYSISGTVLLFFVIVLLSVNSYNTMISTRSPARFLTSHFPLMLTIPFSIFFTTRKAFLVGILMVLGTVVFNIQNAGDILQGAEAAVSLAVTVLTIVLIAALCLAVAAITENATSLRIREYEENTARQHAIKEELIASLVRVAGRMDESSREMKAHSSGFSENIQGQAASMEEITATVEEISAALDNVNGSIDDQKSAIESLIGRMEKLFDAARSMQDRVADASGRIIAISEKAKTGERNMVEMSESIERISVTSKEMTGIINIINDISDRINLLSLNAAIEAARAGDAGRGFAVVADEISKLADQTTSSVKEIGAMISRSESEISRGMKNTRETVAGIGEIIKGINDINAMAGFIEKYLGDHGSANDLVREETERVKSRLEELVISTREQKRAAGEITKSINDMNERTQSNAENAEMIRTNAEVIAHMAGEIKEKTRSFDRDAL